MSKSDSYLSSTPARFQTKKATLLMDRFMTRFIKMGGTGIIAAVCGIFIFIFAMTLPLFKGAQVKESAAFQLQQAPYVLMGADEWGELPFLVEQSGAIHFVDLMKEGKTSTVDPISDLGKKVTAFKYNANAKTIVYGTDDGHFSLVKIQYAPTFEGDTRTIESSVDAGVVLPIGSEGAKVLDIAVGVADEAKLVAAIVEGPNGKEIHAVRIVQERTLFSVGEEEVEDSYNLTGEIVGEPNKILVNSHADEVIVVTEAGQIFYFTEEDEEISLRQSFFPFQEYSNSKIASIDYLLGEVSLVLTNGDGDNQIFSLFVPDGQQQRIFSLTKNFEALPGPATFYNASLRNKAFLIGHDNFASLRYATTETIRWQKKLDFSIKAAIIGGKYDRILLLDTNNKLHVNLLKDPHPEAGMKAFFGKLWYEGYAEPSFQWQSTGGTDDFEPKLSLIPLIIGTLKGTFYAMLFALPIAVLAALYTSQFAHPSFRSIVKPIMEIMASLPSVVLGFLAALWLAPIIETRVPSLIVIIVLLPIASFLTGYLWTSLPIEKRKLIKPGFEWIALLPVLAIGTYIGWQLGPWIEQFLFVVTDPATGQRVGDFRLWWPEITGTPYEQRNSLVVGFMMGFAVIPIIFTIAEDSLSNVPRALVSGSLALGASRWQTAIRVVLPTAFPGIFSAIMIGLGRAVGETMIVVMATGNTPIMDFNIFSGMRTLSANIAVELPEAPYLGTLYRTLFLGALVLFMMTFIVNTIAEIIRQRLREKYRTV